MSRKRKIAAGFAMLAVAASIGAAIQPFGWHWHVGHSQQAGWAWDDHAQANDQ